VVKEDLILNRVEHHLLSMQTDDIEPLFILYADTRRDITGVTFDQINKSLIKLIDMGFSECKISKKGTWQKYKLTLNDLEQRIKGKSEEDIVKHPQYINEYYIEYYFKITDKGRVEEAKEIYDAYYQ
jgi:hypothetical protein